MTQSPALYPLRLAPLAVAKIWGGEKLRHLAPVGALAGQPIGEVWGVWDELAVVGGALSGCTLAEVVRADPVGLLGTRVAAQYGATFPLLVKLLDARAYLSIQVHPDDAQAQALEGHPFGKSEVWYVLEAEPSAEIIHGFRRGITAAEFRAALAEGKLGDLMQTVPVAPGDVVLNLPGTMHALGAGVLIYELQQSADITYRLYDWDRPGDDGQPRALHLDKGLAVTSLGPCALDKLTPVGLSGDGASRTLLCATAHFAAERISLAGPIVFDTAGDGFHILTALGSPAVVRYGAGRRESVEVGAGESLVVPAGLGEYEVAPVGDSAEVIRAFVPDLARDIVAPLAARELSRDAILAVGGGADNRELLECLRASGL
jgi:mannose-6-phosphate isomerase